MSRVLGEGAKPSGFNGDGPTEATFFKHQRAYEAIESDKASLRGKVKKAKKAAADDGVDWDDLKDLSGLRGSGAAEAEAARLQRMARYLGYMKNPLAAVLATMSEFKTDETSLTEEEREKKWRDHGYVGSREGKGLDQVLEGHDPNGDTGRWIRSGWEAGQKENAAPIKEPAKAKGKEKPDTVKADDKPKPQPEPEVAAANKKAGDRLREGVRLALTRAHFDVRNQAYRDEVGRLLAEAEQGGYRPANPRATIAIIEDEPELRTLLRGGLEGAAAAAVVVPRPSPPTPSFVRARLTEAVGEEIAAKIDPVVVRSTEDLEWLVAVLKEPTLYRAEMERFARFLRFVLPKNLELESNP